MRHEWILLPVRADVQNGAAGVSGKETAIAFAILIAIALALGPFFDRKQPPDSDAIRYITYAINLVSHGVFSLSAIDSAASPEPGSVHTPLYPAWVAAFASHDAGLRDTLVCVVAARVWGVRAVGRHRRFGLGMAVPWA